VWNDGDTEEDFLENTPAASYTDELLDNELDFSFNLAELVAGAGMQEQVRMVGPGAMDTFFVSGIADDSRKVQDGDLFVCMKGAKHDGHKYAMEAFATGCAVVVVAEEALAAVRTEPYPLTRSLVRSPSGFEVRLLLGCLRSVR
jgi:UDP-N-acetylmuramyl pentapeptide synthase